MRKNSQGQWELAGDQLSYKFVAIVEGNDLAVYDVKATWFGGDGDLGDDGDTKWHVKNTGEGIRTPRGCALPLDGYSPTLGSPLPHGIVPGTLVKITNRHNHLQGTAELIDLGRNTSARSGAAIDLTQRTFLELGGHIRPGLAKLTCSHCLAEAAIRTKFGSGRVKCGKCGRVLLGPPRTIHSEGGDIPHVDFRIVGGVRFLDEKTRRQAGAR
jgi:hypothetical protein